MGGNQTYVREPEWIKFEFSEETEVLFFQKYKLPGVVGCAYGLLY